MFISLDCIDKLVKCIAKFNIGAIDADTSSKIEKQILTDEIQDPEFLEFARKSYSEMFGYIATGSLNIRINRDIEGIWLGFCLHYKPRLLLIPILLSQRRLST